MTEASTDSEAMHAVLIETSGNQRYIFASNKLRENIGASQLTHEVGRWVSEHAGGDASALQSPIESSGQPEVLVATSGTATVLVPDRAAGEAIVTGVTRRALQEAPGLDVSGVVVPVPPGGDGGPAFAAAVADAHRSRRRVLLRRTAPELRFQRLPIVAPCSTSGMPAAGIDPPSPDHTQARPVLRSAIAAAKHAARDSPSARKRLKKLIGDHADHYEIADEIDELQGDWVMAIHADINGLGRMFLGLEETGGGGGRGYADKLRALSIAVDRCAVAAFRAALTEALEHVHPSDLPRKEGKERKPVLPVIPLIVGGDDLTVLAGGKIGLQLAAAYIRKLRALSLKDDAIREVAPDGLGACAGVAIVKPHFPFSAAYELASALTTSAKVVKDRLSEAWCALDFHVLHDSSGADLGRIRELLEVDGGASALFVRPYLVAGPEACSRHTWGAVRDWDEFAGRASAVSRREDREAEDAIPRGQLHALRGELFRGSSAAERRFRLIAHRHPALEQLGRDGRLFWDDDGGVQRTWLLDSLDAQPFLAPPE